MIPIDKCQTIILSCNKYLHSRSANQNIDNMPFCFRYFIGLENLDEDRDSIELTNKKIVTLNCLDYYENLPEKVYKSIEWIYNNTDCEYILKTDDDIIFNQNYITKIYEQIYQSNIDYAGNLINVSAYRSTWHKNKCFNNEINNSLIEVPSTDYCSGGAYFLSRKSAKFILDNYYQLKPKHLIYEDVTIGYILSHYPNIKKIHINNLNKAFIW